MALAIALPQNPNSAIASFGCSRDRTPQTFTSSAILKLNISAVYFVGFGNGKHNKYD